MLRHIAPLVIAVCFASLSVGQSTGINIIPKPSSIERSTGSFTINRYTKIQVGSPLDRANGELLRALIQAQYGFKLEIVEKYQKRNRILLAEPLSNHQRLPTEDEYLLSVESDSIKILGMPQGEFYGIQTLMQLLPPKARRQTATVPAVYISDAPRFAYRGMHLDVGRHFMPVEFVKKYVDLMSQYKFNYFHLHLTEDQGWRIEIKKYPRLTEIGSKRPETHVGFYSETFKGDGVPHEGFYTQEQIKEIVAYAKARYVTVIPEIEMPGHSSAALAAYPELSCRPDQKYRVQMTWGTFPEVYCPTDRTFQFLEDVISEVVDLFPDSPYIHIGGDEVIKDMWKDSPDVKALMEREHLKDLNEVQSYFVRRMEKFINSKGKRIIGWDEILDGGIAPNATVMSWQGMKGGIAAARAHHDVIMAPTDYSYFDYRQGDAKTEPVGQDAYLPLDKVYSFDPLPTELSTDEARYVLGGQANVWTEYMKTPEAVEYMVFPRMLAMSEVLWTQPENKNYADFTRRLAVHLPRLERQHVNYRDPAPGRQK